MALMAIISTFSAPLSLADDAYTCGLWTDVPSSAMHALTEVCEYGVMQGYSEYNFGFDRVLTRAEAAVVSSRFVFGAEEYASFFVAGNEALTYRNSLTPYFWDMPAGIELNTWMLKGIYFAKGNGVMKGDGDSFPTSFRPYDSGNIVETFKIFYESAREADILGASSKNTYFSYSGEQWYEPLMEHLADEGVFIHYMPEQEAFWIDGVEAYSGWDSAVSRGDASKFVYRMIEANVIDSEKLSDYRAEPIPVVVEEPEPEVTLLDGETLVEELSMRLAFALPEGHTVTIFPTMGDDEQYAKEILVEDELGRIIAHFYAVTDAYTVEEDNCCSYFPGELLDSSNALSFIGELLDDVFVSVFNLEATALGQAASYIGRIDSYEFFRAEEDGESHQLVKTVLVPLGEGGFANMLITGPNLNDFAGSFDPDMELDMQEYLDENLGSLDAELQERLDNFDRILESIAFYEETV